MVRKSHENSAVNEEIEKQEGLNMSVDHRSNTDMNNNPMFFSKRQSQFKAQSQNVTINMREPFMSERRQGKQEGDQSTNQQV